MLYSHPKWGPYVFFWSKICNSKLFSSLSDSENSKWAIRYVCAIKNALVRRTIMKVSLTHCNDPKDLFNHKFGAMKVFQKFFQPLQTPTVDLQKAFFCTHFVCILQFWGRIAKNEELLRFPQLKTDCDVIRRRGALFWKAWDLTNKFHTHYVTDGCFKRKLRPLFYKIFL